METGHWEYHVTNSNTGLGIEKHTSPIAAEDACRTCNNFEKRHGRPPIYIVIPLEVPRNEQRQRQ